MDELRRQEKEQCYDHIALLGYPGYYSDNDSDSDHSVKNKTGRSEPKVSVILLRMVVLKF